MIVIDIGLVLMILGMAGLIATFLIWRLYG
jgi:hypothetical protein